MNISTLLPPEHILCQHTSTSKKRVLEDVAEYLSARFPDINENTIFSSLISREKLGSTGIGNGIAIPHCRLTEAKDIIAMLITLSNGIDFDAIDSQDVDIIFVLIVPEDGQEDHLKTLAAIAEAFSDSDRLDLLRKATHQEELQKVINDIPSS